MASTRGSAAGQVASAPPVEATTATPRAAASPIARLRSRAGSGLTGLTASTFAPTFTALTMPCATEKRSLTPSSSVTRTPTRRAPGATQLRMAAVPEPSAVWLALVGLGVAVAGARRRGLRA